MIGSKHLRDILASKFRSHGEETPRTRLFDDLSDDMRLKILHTANLQADELPVLGSVIDEDNWLLITTKRVIGVDHRHVQFIGANDIKKVVMEPFFKVSELQPEERMNLDALERMKSEATTIKLVKSTGEECFVRAEPGRPYIGIVNAIMHFAHRSHE